MGYQVWFYSQSPWETSGSFKAMKECDQVFIFKGNSDYIVENGIEEQDFFSLKYLEKSSKLVLYYLYWLI